MEPRKMANAVNIHEAKTHLSRLVERAEGGEEILIARAGRPVARLVPLHARTEPRRPGRWRGQVRLAPDFDTTDPWLLDAFEG
jgi:prevent-host-death family protein